ncbi:MAG: nickel pincer cofactor biosynthesis protein LarC [Phycisphaerales bacterium]|nr:MAG: nickel pincer cofactor biosynthesis protein LarC [Phycisphaerales bacterium]
MSIAYFDCFCGAGGDMIVASLVDAGASAEVLREGLASLGLGGYTLSIESVNKQGFAATRFHVQLGEHVQQPHRHLEQIAEILENSGLQRSAKEKATRIFERLAEAEAKVHGTSIEKVHFHEVGAVDAIMDVVGVVLAMDQLHVERVICSPIPTGSGTVICDHGVMPVPAPATSELLKGVPIAACDEAGELITPTGAAILTTLAAEFGPLPAMTVDSIGYGAGTREGHRRPNVLRVLIGETTRNGDADEIAVLETNLDDASPEVVGHCMERLLTEGALDVYAVPIHMKKSRTGVVLTVLCEPGRAEAMQRLLFAETTTFGVRRHNAARVKMSRRHVTVNTPFGDIRVKVGERNGVVTASPEFGDCRAAAEKHNVPLREVITAANAAWSAKRKG